jgi:uncharacterized damage-inducible protein DinB
MKGIALSVAVLLLIAGIVRAQNPPAPPQPAKSENRTVSSVLDRALSNVEKEFVDAADAMPEERYGFAPTTGEFKGVRNFGEQVKHVACGNEAWAKKILGEKPPARCDLGGPNPAKSTAEILAYLKESFKTIDKVIAETDDKNFMQATPGPYWGANRLSSLTATVWHISDHYGQLVVYLRMNGIVPPVSK